MVYFDRKILLCWITNLGLLILYIFTFYLGICFTSTCRKSNPVSFHVVNVCFVVWKVNCFLVSMYFMMSHFFLFLYFLLCLILYFCLVLFCILYFSWCLQASLNSWWLHGVITAVLVRSEQWLVTVSFLEPRELYKPKVTQPTWTRTQGLSVSSLMPLHQTGSLYAFSNNIIF